MLLSKTCNAPADFQVLQKNDPFLFSKPKTCKNSHFIRQSAVELYPSDRYTRKASKRFKFVCIIYSFGLEDQWSRNDNKIRKMIEC